MLTPIATEEERLEIIKECRKSGMPANEWCRQHGLRWNTYHTWVTRLKKKGLIDTAATVTTVIREEAGLPDIVRVGIAGRNDMRAIEYRTEGVWQESISRDEAKCKAVIEIEIGKIRIKASNQVCPQLLAEIIVQIGGIQGC